MVPDMHVPALHAYPGLQSHAVVHSAAGFASEAGVLGLAPPHATTANMSNAVRDISTSIGDPAAACAGYRSSPMSLPRIPSGIATGRRVWRSTKTCTK